jgi:hypothetical protein
MVLRLAPRPNKPLLSRTVDPQISSACAGFIEPQFSLKWKPEFPHGGQGCIKHRQFLLRFAKDRDGYRQRIRNAALNGEASLLTYNRVGVGSYQRSMGRFLGQKRKP